MLFFLFLLVGDGYFGNFFMFPSVTSIDFSSLIPFLPTVEFTLEIHVFSETHPYSIKYAIETDGIRIHKPGKFTERY